MRLKVKHFDHGSTQQSEDRPKKRSKTKNLSWIHRIYRLVARFFNRKSKCKVMPANNVISEQLTDELIRVRLNQWTGTRLSTSESELNPDDEAELQQEYQQMLGEWLNLIDIIGYGALGKIYRAIHKITGEFVAVKVFDKEKLIAHEQKFAMECAYNEIQILKTLDHPNVIKLYQVIETDRMIFVVLELCEKGDLLNLINSKIASKELATELEAKRIFFQVVSAVKYLHSRNIAHRDLKLDNVVLDENGCAKLIDFNSCAKMTPKSSIGKDSRFAMYKPLKTHCGTIDFLSPEIIRGGPYDGIRSDSWSLGVMLYSMLCNKYPFNSDDETDLKKILKKITLGVYNEPKHLSVGRKKLLRRLLNLDPNLRSTSEEIISDPWFEELDASNESLRIPKKSNPKDLDEEIISAMSIEMSIPVETLRQSISKMDFQTNELTTYLILTNMKKIGTLVDTFKYFLWKNQLELFKS